MTTFRVKDNDLSDLAAARAKRVRDYLVDSEKIDPGRIFLVKADTRIQTQDDQPAKARVRLTIK